MLLHLPIVIMATLSPVAVSDTVPKFDIVRECRFEGGSTVQFDRCSEDEGAALRDLQQAWAQFGGADKKSCTLEATASGFSSYVELLTCLEMVGNPNNVNDHPRGLQATDAMRPRGPSATVGVGPGHVPDSGNR